MIAEASFTAVIRLPSKVPVLVDYEFRGLLLIMLSAGMVEILMPVQRQILICIMNCTITFLGRISQKMCCVGETQRIQNTCLRVRLLKMGM